MKLLFTAVAGLSLSLLLAAGSRDASAADYEHCNNVTDVTSDTWLYHGERTYFSSLKSDPQPIFEATADGTVGLKTLDMSTVLSLRDVPVSLKNAEKNRYKFTISDKTAVRIELVPNSPGPHGELEVGLFTDQGVQLYRDIDNGLYHDASWSGKYARNVPRIETVLPAGHYTLELCNSYVSDAGVLRLGRITHDALTQKNPNPFVKDNDL